MDIQGIITLINAVSAADIMNFQVEEGNFRLKIDKQIQKVEVSPTLSAPIPMIGTQAVIGTQQQIVPPASMRPMRTEVSQANVEASKEQGSEVSVVNHLTSESGRIETVNSPIVGTFYSASGPDTEDFVKVGDQVKKGQVLCIIEAMKLMNEIESDYDGEVIDILVKNEEIVEYGKPLFKIKVQ